MNEDFELTLFDRLEMIRKVLKDTPDDQIYLSFSGGKDSTVVLLRIEEKTFSYVRKGMRENLVHDRHQS